MSKVSNIETETPDYFNEQFNQLKRPRGSVELLFIEPKVESEPSFEDE